MDACLCLYHNASKIFFVHCAWMSTYQDCLSLKLLILQVYLVYAAMQLIATLYSSFDTRTPFTL